MDSEDAMEAALQREAKLLQMGIDPVNWLNGENTRRRIARQPQLTSSSPEFLERFPSGIPGEQPAQGEIEFNLPTSEVVPMSTLEFDTYKLICQLLNQLEGMGENLVAFGDAETGHTELSGVNHALVYDLEANKWVIQDTPQPAD